jgi:hypothetical protein
MRYQTGSNDSLIFAIGFGDCSRRIKHTSPLSQKDSREDYERKNDYFW